MTRSRSLAAALIGTALAVVSAFSQEAGRSEVSVQAFGGFVKDTNQNGVPQSAINSGGVLANYRFFFSRATEWK